MPYTKYYQGKGCKTYLKLKPSIKKDVRLQQLGVMDHPGTLQGLVFWLVVDQTQHFLWHICKAGDLLLE